MGEGPYSFVFIYESSAQNIKIIIIPAIGIRPKNKLQPDFPTSCNLRAYSGIKRQDIIKSISKRIPRINNGQNRRNI